MNAATASEIARLKTLTITQIVRQFESLFGEKCRSRNTRYLIRRIAWRLQANAEGDLSERAKARAAELALDSEVRVSRCLPSPASFLGTSESLAHQITWLRVHSPWQRLPSTEG
jgi:hypothetical protein